MTNVNGKVKTSQDVQFSNDSDGIFRCYNLGVHYLDIGF